MKRLAHGSAGPPRRKTGSFEKGLYGVSEMLFEAFLGLMEAGVLRREVDGVALHGAFFLGPKIILSRAAREDAGSDRADPDDAGSFTNELYGEEAAEAARPGRRPLRQ